MSLRFDLHQLGWFAFEQLSRTICREVYGQPVEVDDGIDEVADGT